MRDKRGRWLWKAEVDRGGEGAGLDPEEHGKTGGGQTKAKQTKLPKAKTRKEPAGGSKTVETVAVQPGTRGFVPEAQLTKETETRGVVPGAQQTKVVLEAQQTEGQQTRGLTADEDEGEDSTSRSSAAQLALRTKTLLLPVPLLTAYQLEDLEGVL